MKNIVLLGKTSAGKSASGNTILGQEEFSSKYIKNQTPVVQDSCVYIDGVTLTVYDTPGLFDPETTNEDVMKQWQSLLHLVSSVSTVFLLVMKIDRFTPEEKKTVELIEEFLEDQRLQNTWILFTRGDELESEGLTIEKCISETEELKRVVQRFNNRYHVFNNIKHDPDQVRRLIEKIKANQNVRASKASDSQVLNVFSVFGVMHHLKDGLWSMNRIYEALIGEDVDSFSGQCRNYSFIREQIVETEQSLQKSEQATNSRLKSLDENIEILTRDEGKLEREKRFTQQTLDNLKTEQESNNKLLKQSEESVEVARSHLRSARDTLQKQKERKSTAGIVTGVGAGLFFIPVVGWIAGSAMVIGGAVGLVKASDAVEVAEEEERRSESEVDRYRSRVSEYYSKISQTKSKISQKHDAIEQIRKKIQKVKEQRAAVAEFQSNVRKAVHILSILSGRVSVVECQTGRFIHLEPVMKVMEDVMKAAGNIGGSQLLSDEDVPRLLNTMRENNIKLAAICNSSNNPEDEGYC